MLTLMNTSHYSDYNHTYDIVNYLSLLFTLQIMDTVSGVPKTNETIPNHTLLKMYRHEM